MALSVTSTLSRVQISLAGKATLSTADSSFPEASLRCSTSLSAGKSSRISAALPDLVPSFTHVKARKRADKKRISVKSKTVSCRAAVQEAPARLRVEEDVLEELNERAESIVNELHGANIFLIGMMGCGKTTVGRLLAEALGYGFSDSDSLVEQTVGTSVANIFAEQGELAFRNLESQAVNQLASMRGLVVATGGGVILRPGNWRCMKDGIVAWLDVPRDVLAERVVAAGVGSRPILSESGENVDPVTQALKKLNTVYEKREHLYSAADLRISLHDLAESKDCQVNQLSPAQIALQVISQVEDLLERRSELQELVTAEGEDVECIRNEFGQCILPYNLDCSEKLAIRLGDMVSQ